MSEPENPRNFEEALLRLEGIIKMMEAHDLPLEEMLVRYEEGINLVKYCGDKLDDAEQRIKIITETSAGKPELVDFEPSKIPEVAASPVSNPESSAPAASNPAKPARSRPAPDSTADDEVSLF